MALDSILNYFDNVCLAVKNHVVDEDIVFECLSSIVIANSRWAKLEKSGFDYTNIVKCGGDLLLFDNPQNRNFLED